MLVSHRRKFIYTKTLKTAGTSVESYFEPFCMADGEWTPSHYREEYAAQTGIVGYRGMAMPKNCTWWSHMPAALIRDRLGEAAWTTYFKFCVVRNPYEKALSTFYWRRSIGTIQVEASDSDPVQFEHWLETAGPPIDRETYLIDGHFCLDAVVRYESLLDDLERTCATLEVPWVPASLPSFKAGVRPPNGKAAAVYTQRSKDIVRTAYAFELDFFGYSFPADVAAH